ncbi:MAG TPA: polysaccharide biosynthesis tyrosine autokinase [Gemmatimonadales bacterium]|nr:polysaccharide biosynthesis tyrosine autokinase [Gemmatimonadales bacterium]
MTPDRVGGGGAPLPVPEATAAPDAARAPAISWMGEETRPAPARDPEARAGAEVGPLELWWVVWRRRWLILACGLLCAAAAVALLSRRPTLYRSAATLRVEDRRGQVPVLDLLRPGDDETDTDVEMLGSTDLAQQVVDSLGLRLVVAAPARVSRGAVFAGIRVDPALADTAVGRSYRFLREDSTHLRLLDPVAGTTLGRVTADDVVTAPGVTFRLRPAAFQYPQLDWTLQSLDGALGEVAGGLDVTRTSRGASIIRVQYTGLDPALAQAVPNALVAAFIRNRVLSNQAGAQSTAEFLRGQVAKLSGQLRAAEDSLRDYREAHGIVSLPTEATTGVTRTSEIEAQRNAIAAERAALGALVAKADEAARRPRAPGSPSPYRRLVAFPSLLRNQATGALLGEINAAEERRSDLLARRSPSDPEVRFLDDRVAQLEDQLHEVVTTYLTGLANQVTALDATLAQSTRQLAGIPEKEVQYARLERDVKNLEGIVTQLQSRLKEAEVAAAVQAPSVSAVDTARLPTGPLPRHRARWAAAALVAGMLVGLLLAIGREYLDETVHTRGDVLAATGAPILGVVPRIAPRQLQLLLGAASPPRARKRHGRHHRGGAQWGTSLARRTRAYLGATPQDQYTMLSEVYDQIETNLALTYPSREMKVLMVTSPLPGDGKTTSAANLACSLARRGERVVLIDADLRRGTLSSLLRVPSEPGLADVLQGRLTLEQTVRRQHMDGAGDLYYITSGRRSPLPGHLLKSERLREVLQQLREECDRVVIDTPPVNVVADAAVLGQVVDGMIIIVRAGTTPFPALVSMAEACRNAGVPMVGAVLNAIDFDRDATYDRAYRWYGLSRQYYAAAGAAERT